jgi:hypothetical protein
MNDHCTLRKWTHRGHLEHGGEGEVALVRVDDDHEGRSGDVPEGAHDGERQNGGRRGHQQRVQVAAGVVLQRLPHAAPPVDAREAEHGRVETRRQQIQEAAAPRRREPPLQRRLREAEHQVQRAANHQRDPAAQRRVLRRARAARQSQTLSVGGGGRGGVAASCFDLHCRVFAMSTRVNFLWLAFLVNLVCSLIMC